MSTPAKRRLVRDFKHIQDDPPPGISAAPKEDDIMNWNAVIFGPPGTPYEDGTFHLTLEFSEEYPNKAPKVKFISKMFHPNIYTDGSICLDILGTRWSPTYDVSAILTSVQSLLDEPNPNSPANAFAAQLYTENRNEYVKHVSSIVELSWIEAVGESGINHSKLSNDVPSGTETQMETSATTSNNANLNDSNIGTNDQQNETNQNLNADENSDDDN